MKPSHHRRPKAPCRIQRATRAIHTTELRHKQRESNEHRLARPTRQHEDRQYKLCREKHLEKEAARDADGGVERSRGRQRAREQRVDNERGGDTGDQLCEDGVEGAQWTDGTD
jgi:hypothetical protein